MKDEYYQINGSGRPKEDESPKWPRWVTIVSVIAFSAIAAVVTYFITSKASSPDSNKPYVQPLRYQANLQFRMPYLNNFTEPLVAHVDNVAGRMRLDYYGGMDTFIFDIPSQMSYSIVPVYTTMTCLSTNQTGTGFALQTLFPDLSRFAKTDKQESVTIPVPDGSASIVPSHPVTHTYKTYNCDVWRYTAGTPSNDPNSSYVQPDDKGYAGVYSFYVDSDTGKPVAFHVQGHNVVFSGSHTDEYWLDYLSVTELPEVPLTMFAPPSGMPCFPTDEPFGPTHTSGGAARMSHPLDDLHMLFPEGADKRASAFDAWADHHGKAYASEQERSFRAAVFHTNQRYIHAVNRAGKSYKLATNHLADLQPHERALLNGYVRPDLSAAAGPAPDAGTPNYDPLGACSVYQPKGGKLPDSVDWRSVSNGGPQPEPGLVLPPKDQGTCGSCWTYGTTGAIEGAWAKKTGNLVPLSQQNMMDCTWRYMNNACDGGTDYLAYAWILQQNNGLIASAASYGEYLNQDGFCHFAVNDKLTTNPFTGEQVQAGARITGCQHVTPFWNSTATPDPVLASQLLSDALANVGPVSVAIDATLTDFYFYKSGYFNNKDCLSDANSLDHIVLAVGYKTLPNGERYTLIRNSWSSNWGENGYAWLAQKGNICGAGTQPSIVTV